MTLVGGALDPLAPLVPTTLGAGYDTVVLIVYVLYVIALWRVFGKAGYPGILAIIPVVNVFFWVKIAGYSAWLALLFLIPVVNVVLAIVVAVRVGRGFGKGGVWSFLLLWLVSLVGVFVLGFGRARYTRPV